MSIAWAWDGEGLHTAKVELDGGGVVHLVVEELIDIGWDWQVWDAAHEARLHYGLADVVDEAKVRAERALAKLTRELVS